MLSIRNNTKTKLPRINFGAICDFALGKDFEVSLVFTGKTFSKKLNIRFRNKDTATNILSFPLSKDNGEIFICPEIARARAEEDGEKYGDYLARLFIHGICHLKGYEHGSKMEREEAKIRKNFKL